MYAGRWWLALVPLGALVGGLLLVARFGPAAVREMGAAVAGGAKVKRGTAGARQALLSAATHLEMPRLQVADAWREPGCSGVAVFLRSSRQVVWAWYDLEQGLMAQHITGEEILELVGEQLPLETDARTWEIGRGDAWGRPRYYLGYLQDSGEQVWLHPHTESCGLQAAEVEITRDGQEPGRRVGLGAAIQKRFGQPYPGPEIDLYGPITEQADKPTAEYTEWTANTLGTLWHEPACDGVVVYETPIKNRADGIWMWYDLKQQAVTESVRNEELMAAVRSHMAGVELWQPKVTIWGEDQTFGVGGRPRYWVGAIRNRGQDLWLHPGTQTCGLSRPQLEIAWHTNIPGRFYNLQVRTTPVGEKPLHPGGGGLVSGYPLGWAR